ncbi:MAG: hypothetical protein MSC30_20125 [Gaiellaceae bacterium MAG52_C11]|nr:hypothetical protein [Candidatus Gaiellasilicea maunaloa]
MRTIAERVEPKPGTPAVAQPYRSELDRVRVDPGTLYPEPTRQLRHIDQLTVSPIGRKQLRHPPRDRLNPFRLHPPTIPAA